MTDTTHTPGPWGILNGKLSVQIHAGKHWIANLKCESCPAHEDANARLIAAAPIMYNFLASKAGGGDNEAIAIMEKINGDSQRD